MPNENEKVLPKEEFNLDNLSDEDLMKMSKRLNGLKVEKPIVNEVFDKLEEPKEIVFTIKARIPEDAMYENGYIPGKTLGVFPSRGRMVLTNKNLNSKNPSANNYITGFDEDSYLVRKDLTDEEKSKIIKEMRIAKVWLERETGQSLNSNNSSLWRDRFFVLDSFGALYTTKNPEHLFLYYNILGGGYDDISPDFTTCERKGKLIYMSVMEAEAKRSFSSTKTNLTAMGKLADIMNNWGNEDSLYLTYHLLKQPHGYTYNTPKEVIIEELKQFIEGADTKNEKKKRPQEFLDAMELFSRDPDKLKISALVNAAIYFGFIINDSKKNLSNKITGFNYGSMKETAIDKLMDLKNLEEFQDINKRVKKKWD